MKKTLASFIRKDIAAMENYVPGTSAWDLANSYNQKIDKLAKLNANENPFGASPVLKKVIKNCLYHYYPPSDYRELRNAIAAYAGVATDNIVVGSGSDELIDLLLRLMIEPGEKIVTCPPSFSMYDIFAKLNKGIAVQIPRKSDFSINTPEVLKAIKANTVKMLFLCNPNNPTGTVTPLAEIETLLSLGKPIIVDEAYFEFGNISSTPLLKKYKNLIVLRTFSKWAGLAGLRIGYGIMDPFLVNELMKIKSPFNVNLVAEQAAIATLTDLSFAKKTITTITKEREKMYQNLKKVPSITVYPSTGNFLFVRIPESDYENVRDSFEKKKISLRYFQSPLLGKGIRITIGKPEQNNTILSVFSSLFPNQYDSIIFDMDGVLVDVSKSYRQAIKKTVAYVLQTEYGIRKIITSEYIEELKRIPGFNNDWDLSFTLIQLLKKKIALGDFSAFAKRPSDSIKQGKEYLYIKDIFQSYYLGTDLFYKLYKRMPPVTVSDGLITKETLLIDTNLLKSLGKKYRLGVATSRPRFEALFTLRNFDITPEFISEKNVIAQEDATKEKPAPDPLLKAKKRLQSKQSLYVGDSINDIHAASAANMPCVFIGKDEHADFQIDTVNNLLEVII